jgi:hypothetical protein
MYQVLRQPRDFPVSFSFTVKPRLLFRLTMFQLMALRPATTDITCHLLSIVVRWKSDNRRAQVFTVKWQALPRPISMGILMIFAPGSQFL